MGAPPVASPCAAPPLFLGAAPACLSSMGAPLAAGPTRARALPRHAVGRRPPRGAYAPWARRLRSLGAPPVPASDSPARRPPP
ncbi:hypothetical protein U9M48_001580 [Paspalum notatum var. saurae]|uniref:Uncharacterized protein n=1 Tax=Paspalum notatum var. saurae TaxID=547442 RepID=A0AAQ3PPP6_PASNO